MGALQDENTGRDETTGMHPWHLRREKGRERHVTTGCAATDPGGHRTTRTGSAYQAPSCRQYLCVAAQGSGEQSRAACSLLLPDLLETQVLLWGGQAAGIVCPIPPSLPIEQIGGLLQAAKAKVLVAPSPSVNQDLWQKTERVRRQAESIALVLQVRGPGKEREAAYAFNALVEEYPADRLHTGREIALDDLAVTLPIRDTTGTLGLVPLTRGNLLYTAWALGLVTTLAPEEVLLHGLSRFFQGGWWPAGSS